LNRFENFSKKWKKGERPKQNTTNYISILSIPDLKSLFTFTTIKDNGVLPDITLFD
jgi:hypothetical protein